MTSDVRRGLFRNWGLKLAALFLSLLLYVAVAAQEQVTQELPMKLDVRVPPGRTLLGAPEALTVVLRGKIAELLRLRLFRQVITLQVPDTLSTATWTATLQVGSVDLPKGADVQVAEIKPSTVTIQLDSVASKEVPIVARVTVQPESGQAIDGGLQITPSVARLVGPDRLLSRIESVATVPTAFDAVRGSFTRLVQIDTSPLGIVRVTPLDVRVSGSTTAVFERVFNLLPVESGAGPLTGYELRPARATVVVRGPEALVQALTKDSLKVIVHLTGPVSDTARVRVMVLAPRGITARAVPDSVLVVRRRSGRG
jgi:YbbR domain-containing protein